MGVRITVPLLAEVLDRLACHTNSLFPFVGARTVERLDENAVVPAGVPAEVRPGGEGEVAYAVGGEVPGQCALGRRPGALNVSRFILRNNRDGRRRPAGRR